MKLEFLTQGSADCPLIRRYSFTSAEVVRLREIFNQLAVGEKPEVAVHREPGFESVDRCNLQFPVGPRDRGVFQVAPLVFECSLSREAWTDASWLLEPFCANKHAEGYQWLNARGPVSLLLSFDGKG